MPFLDQLFAGLTDMSQGKSPGSQVKLPLPPPSSDPRDVGKRMGFTPKDVPVVDADLQRQAELLRIMADPNFRKVPMAQEPLPWELQDRIDTTQRAAEIAISKANWEQADALARRKMLAKAHAREFARREAELAAGRTPEFREPTIQPVDWMPPTGLTTPLPNRRR